MKVVCDKCLCIENDDNAISWIKITVCGQGTIREFRLCPYCQKGLDFAIDNRYPPIYDWRTNKALIINAED